LRITAHFQSLIIFLVFLILAGCSKSPEISEIPGMYRVHGIPGYGQLKIMKNGRYVQYSAKSIGKGVIFNQGTWSTSTKGATYRLIFDHFIFLESEKNIVNGIWSPIVERKGGNVALCFDPDVLVENGCFTKGR
jgi:hypothetical protein